MGAHPVLRPPDHVVQIPRGDVDRLPRLTADPGRPLGDAAAADAVPEQVEERIAKQVTHDGPFDRRGPWMGLALPSAHDDQSIAQDALSSRSSRGPESGARRIPIRAMRAEGASVCATDSSYASDQCELSLHSIVMSNLSCCRCACRLSRSGLHSDWNKSGRLRVCSSTIPRGRVATSARAFIRWRGAFLRLSSRPDWNSSGPQRSVSIPGRKK